MTSMGGEVKLVIALYDEDNRLIERLVIEQERQVELDASEIKEWYDEQLSSIKVSN